MLQCMSTPNSNSAKSSVYCVYCTGYDCGFMIMGSEISEITRKLRRENYYVVYRHWDLVQCSSFEITV